MVIYSKPAWNSDFHRGTNSLQDFSIDHCCTGQPQIPRWLAKPSSLKFPTASLQTTLLELMQGRARGLSDKPCCVGGVLRTSAMEAASCTRL